jgi:hypothetical protein
MDKKQLIGVGIFIKIMHETPDWRSQTYHQVPVHHQRDAAFQIVISRLDVKANEFPHGKIIGYRNFWSDIIRFCESFHLRRPPGVV